MKIELFEHNQTAYQAALDMLKTTGKAAIASYGYGEILYRVQTV